MLALMLSIARFLLVHIGLPWLSELGRYSELQRQRVHEWIDDKNCDEGLDPEKAEAASDVFIERLESTTRVGAKDRRQHEATVIHMAADGADRVERPAQLHAAKSADASVRPISLTCACYRAKSVNFGRPTLDPVFRHIFPQVAQFGS